MATVPIVTEVTKAQLDALVADNELNEGLQYKVTDKNWLLVATSSNTLKAATGSLTTTNTFDFPNYISSDFLFVDTGVVTEIAQPYYTYQIYKPQGYNPFAIELEIISQDDLRTYKMNGQNITVEDSDLQKYSTVLTTPQLVTEGGGEYSVLECVGFINNIDSFRAVLSLCKSKF